MVRRFLLWVLSAAVLVGCSSAPPAPEEPDVEVLSGEVAVEKTPELVIDSGVVENAVRVRKVRTPFADFVSVPFAELPTARSVDWENALKAFRISCRTTGLKPLWQDACVGAALTENKAAYDFFNRTFEAWKVVSREDKANPTDTGLMTGYYEPMLRGSKTRHGDYQYPLYGVPDDLITVDLAGLHPQLKGLRLRGRLRRAVTLKARFCVGSMIRWMLSFCRFKDRGGYYWKTVLLCVLDTPIRTATPIRQWAAGSWKTQDSKKKK